MGTVFVFMTYISYTRTLTDFSKDITLKMNEIERYTGIFNSIFKLIIGRRKTEANYSKHINLRSPSSSPDRVSIHIIIKIHIITNYSPLTL